MKLQKFLKAGRRIDKVEDLRHRIETNAAEGMKVPLTIRFHKHTRMSNQWRTFHTTFELPPRWQD